MSENSKIQWTDHTFNAWRGCVKVSPGCANCYAEHAPPTRIARAAGVETWGKDAVRMPASEAMWREPEKWNRRAERDGVRARVFCASLADVFEDRRDLDVHRKRLFDLIRRTPWLDWQLLTKRPENILPLLPRAWDYGGHTAELISAWIRGEPPANVWIGTTVEDQQRADERIPRLLEVPAAVRFLSVEPMLGPVDLRKSLGGTRWLGGQRGCEGTHFGDGSPGCPREAHHHHDERCGSGVDWVIVGGESGPHARPFDIAWARSIVAQCRTAEVPCFVKQLGAAPGEVRPEFPLGTDLVLIDRKGGDMDEWPEDLRVRQMPTGKAKAAAERDPWEHNPGARPMPHPGAK